MRTGRRDAAWRSLDAADEPDVGIFERCLAHRDATNLSRGDRGDERGAGALGDARRMQKRPGEMQRLLHAARVALDALVSSCAEVYESEQLLHPRGDLTWRDGIELSEVAEVVSTGEAVVEPALAAKDEADLAANLLCVADDVEPEDASG